MIRPSNYKNDLDLLFPKKNPIPYPNNASNYQPAMLAAEARSGCRWLNPAAGGYIQSCSKKNKVGGSGHEPSLAQNNPDAA